MKYSNHSIGIYARSGQERFRTEINIGSKAYFTLMKEDYIILKFNTEDVINFKVGDYIDTHETYDGEHRVLDMGLVKVLPARFYEITESYIPKVNQNGGYSYELRLNAYYYKWANKKFQLITTSTSGEEIQGVCRKKGKVYMRRSESSWSTTGLLKEHLDIVIANLYVMGYGFDGQEIGYDIDTSAIVDKYRSGVIPMHYDNESILDALFRLAKECECDCWIEGGVIYFGRIDNGEPLGELEVGNHIKNISSSNGSKTYATRLYVYGSDRNVPATYRKKLEFVSSNEGRNIKDDARPLTYENFTNECYEYKNQQGLFLILANDLGYAEDIEQAKDATVFNPVNNGDTATLAFRGNGTTYSTLNVFRDKGRKVTAFAIDPDSISDTFNVSINAEIGAFWAYVNTKGEKVGLYDLNADVYLYYKHNGNEVRIGSERIVLTPDFIKPLGETQAFAEGKATLDIKTNTVNLSDIDVESGSKYIYFSFGQNTDINDVVFYFDFFSTAQPFEVSGRYPMVHTKVKVGETEYDAVLNPDYTMNGHDLVIDGELEVGTKYTITKGLLTSSVRASYFTDEEDNFVVQSIYNRRLMLPQKASEGYSGHGFIDAYPDMTEEEIIEDSLVIEDVMPKKKDKITKIKTYTYYEQRTDENTGEELPGKEWDAYMLEAEYFSPRFDERYITDKSKGLYISFYSGLLAGMEFEVKFGPYHEGDTSEDLKEYSKYFEIIAKEDNGVRLPNETLKPSVGDEFTFYGYDSAFVSDEDLVEDAEKELLRQGIEYLQKAMYQDVTYNVDMYMGVVRIDDEERMIAPGDRVVLRNPSFFEDKRSVRVIGYEICLDIPRDNPKYTMGEAVAYSRISAIENKASVSSGVVSNTSTISGGGGSSITIIGTKSNTLETDRNVYSAKRVKEDFLSKKGNDSTPYDLGMRNADVSNDLLVGGDASVSGTVTTPKVETDEVESSTVHTQNFSPGELLGRGASIYDDNGDGRVEADYISVRKAAWFRSVTIEEVNHVGGELILSAAACVLSRVQWLGEGGYLLYDTGMDANPSAGDVAIYRCLFEKGANGRVSYNEWKIGDQARCQEFNLGMRTFENVSTKFYWRVVVGKGDGTEIGLDDYYYIDLSNDQGILDWSVIVGEEESANYDTGKGCANGSNVPMPNDSVVLLGTRSNTDLYRRSAQVYSTAEANSPSRRYYQNIHDFDLTHAQEIETLEWDSAKSHTHWKVGSNDEYVDFSRDGLNIRAKKIVLSGTGKEIDEILGREIEVYMLTEEDGKPEPRMEVDGTVIGSTLKPWDWDEYQSHENAVCITSQGLCYRWERHDTWIWRAVSDKYLIEALNRADNIDLVISEMTSDGKILPGEKIVLQRLRDGMREQHDSIGKAVDLLIETDPLKKTPGYYLTLKREYEEAYGSLVNEYDTILGSQAPIIEIDKERVDLLTSEYTEKCKAVQSAISEANNFYFEQTADMTKLGNTYFKPDGRGGWAVKDNGLVITDDFSKVFSRQVLGDEDKTLEAEISVGVTDGISNANISAEQISLNGYTSVNNRLFINNQGDLFAEQGVFGGMARSSWKVICKKNHLENGYIGQSGQYSIDIDKAGSLFMIYEKGSGWSQDTTNQSDDVGVIADTMSLSLPYYVGGGQTSDWADAMRLLKARQYVGKKIVFYYCPGRDKRLNIVGVRNDGTYEDTATAYHIHILECVMDRSVNMSETIYWTLDKTISVLPSGAGQLYRNERLGEYKTSAEQYMYGLPTYHSEADRMWYAGKGDDNGMLTQDDKYHLYESFQRVLSNHVQIMRRKDDYTAVSLLSYQAKYAQLYDLLARERFFILNDGNGTESTLFGDDMDLTLSSTYGNKTGDVSVWCFKAWRQYWDALENLALK